MKIRQIRLKNFKAFKDVSIDLKPITLLTGVNSSGKSSVLNTIAVVLQTQSPHMFPFDIVLNGDNCSLGTFQDVVTNNKSKLNFGLGFTIVDSGHIIHIDSDYRYSPRGEHILPNNIEIFFNEDVIKIAWEGSPHGYRYSGESKALGKIQKDKSYQILMSSLAQILSKEESKKKRKKFTVEDVLSQSTKIENNITGTNISSKDLTDNLISNPAGNFLFNQLRNFSVSFQNHVSYVGPIRALPLRFYTPDKPQFSVDPQGSNCTRLLNNWKKHQNEKFRQVLALLKLLELIENMDSKSTTDDILKLYVKPFGRKEESNFIDVGFGVSQALPFIVSDIALPSNGGVLAINQPEVHLHPSSQAKLANYFASRCKTRQYIVETHSEYLINRLRLLVLNKEANSEDITILFFNSKAQQDQTPEVTSIGINPDGSLKNAPPEFFDTYFSDSFRLAMGGDNSND